MTETKKSFDRFHNRDLSWLQFNARVLQEARDPSVPLIERLRFLGIFSNNLDEFFKVRYATIKRIVEAGKQGLNELGGISAKDLQEEITQTVIGQQQLSLDILGGIEKELGHQGIHIIKENQITPQQSVFIKDYFLKEVSPALVTMILEGLDEFPALKDSAAYLAVRMVMNKNSDTDNNDNKTSLNYALIEIPKVIDRFVVLPEIDGEKYIILLDDLIRHCLGIIFSIFDYKEISAYMIKITRDAELDIDSDLSRSFLDKISKSVAKRSSGDPVRFVYDRQIDRDTLDFLMQKMKIESTDSVIPGGRYHNRRDYMKFPSLGRQDLLYQTRPPLRIKGLNFEGSLLAKIAKKDYLLHAPYQSFRYVVKFLREAALDPQVKIKLVICYS